MLLKLNKTQQSALAGSYVSYFQARCNIFAEGNPLDVNDVYARSSFNEQCNMVYPRAGNTIALGYDTAAPVVLGEISIDAAFAQQVNEYCALAQSKGAAVYFSFSPINRSALMDEARIQAYFSLCNDTFACPVISDPNRYILDSGWFYDSNFHLNSAGAALRTYRLAEDLLAQFGCAREIEYTMPQKPESIAQVDQDSSGSQFFLFEALEGGWLVSGLSAEGQAETALAVPASYKGKPVVGFTSDALARAEHLQELTLPESIESLPDRLFAQCARLERLVLNHRARLCSIGKAPFDGAPNLRIFVPSQSYPLYRDGDGCEANPWAEHLDRIYTFG